MPGRWPTTTIERGSGDPERIARGLYPYVRGQRLGRFHEFVPSSRLNPSSPATFPWTSPQIDGRLDEEVWTAADAIDDLVQNEPDNMAPPTERTVVRVAYDDRYLYVAVYNYMREPSQITTGLGRRDNLPPSDQILITFDPRHDHITAYTFVANPSGVQSDFTWFDNIDSSNDYSGV